MSENKETIQYTPLALGRTEQSSCMSAPLETRHSASCDIPSCPDLTNSLKKSQFYPSAGLYTINHSNISQRQTVMTSEPQFISGIQKYAVSNKTLSFDSNNKCCISRHGDLCTFKYICIKQSDNIHRLESFSLYIEDACIITYYVDFLKEIVKDFITIISNTVLYKFPNEMLYEPIRLMSLYNQNVYIKLNFVNDDQANNIDGEPLSPRSTHPNYPVSW